MFDLQDRRSQAGFPALRVFVSDHAEALACAAELLAGLSGRKRVVALIDDLRDSVVPTRRLVNEVFALYRLLNLENVGNPDRIETWCFAQIEPEAPFVSEICLLADQLGEHLAALAEDRARSTNMGGRQ